MNPWRDTMPHKTPAQKRADDAAFEALIAHLLPQPKPLPPPPMLPPDIEPPADDDRGGPERFVAGILLACSVGLVLLGALVAAVLAQGAV